MHEDTAPARSWADREPYDRLLSLDRADWAWQAACRSRHDRPGLLRFRAGTPLARAPLVRSLVAAESEADTPVTANWGWRFRSPG